MFFMDKTAVSLSIWLLQPEGNNSIHNDAFSIFYSLYI